MRSWRLLTYRDHEISRLFRSDRACRLRSYHGVSSDPSSAHRAEQSATGFAGTREMPMPFLPWADPPGREKCLVPPSRGRSQPGLCAWVKSSTSTRVGGLIESSVAPAVSVVTRGGCPDMGEGSHIRKRAGLAGYRGARGTRLPPCVRFAQGASPLVGGRSPNRADEPSMADAVARFQRRERYGLQSVSGALRRLTSAAFIRHPKGLIPNG